MSNRSVRHGRPSASVRFAPAPPGRRSSPTLALMQYNYPRLFEVLLRAVASDASVSERMHSLIDECAHQVPHNDWSLLSQPPLEFRDRLCSCMAFTGICI
jgi:hypothetical protein